MIKIICVGKIKESYIKEGILDYQKRISKYHKIEIIEVMDSNIDEEKDRILKYIDKKDYLITLDIEGNNLSSLELADKIDKTFITNSNITFIIGGSNGIHKDIKDLANKILNNETYHK